MRAHLQCQFNRSIKEQLKYWEPLYVPLRKLNKGEETLRLEKAVPHFIFQIRDVNGARKARCRHR
jgi:hypothetical protein